MRTGNREADLAVTMQRVVESLETMIRRSPHQWYMFRDMWPDALPVQRRQAVEGRVQRWWRAACAGGWALVRPLLTLLTSGAMGR